MSFVYSFSSLWRYAISHDKVTFDNSSGDNNSVATTDNLQPSSATIRNSLYPHCQAVSLPLQSGSTNAVAGAKDLKRLVETQSLAVHPL